MTKNYDVLLLPTGETTSGDRSFPVSREAINLFSSGRFGHIFVTGGFGGFSNIIPGKSKPEAEETVEYLSENRIPGDKIYHDSQSLDTMGNFTFPLVQPMNKNPKLSEFKNILVIGRDGHMLRARDYASLVFPSKNGVEFYTIPGKHNSGFLTDIYHQSFMHVLRKNHGAEEIHNFLLNNHPFYSEGWYNKSQPRRKVEMALTGLSWFLRDFNK